MKLEDKFEQVLQNHTLENPEHAKALNDLRPLLLIYFKYGCLHSIGEISNRSQELIQKEIIIPENAISKLVM